MQQSVGKANSSGKKAQKRPKVQFKLVQQSYEDKDYEDKPKPVLVPAALADHRHGKRRKGDQHHPMFVFGEDMPEDFSNRRNMLMTDDTRPGEEHLFDDEVEEEFDEHFIQQMMYGEVDEEDEDLFDDDEEDDDNFYDDDDEDGEGDGGERAVRGGRQRSRYAQHDTTTRAIDRQFAKAMREFDVDEGINDASVDDPRTHGPLDIDQYYAALEEFVEDHVAYSTETAEPLKNKGLIHQLKKMAHRNRVFDSNAGGVFYTTLLPDKKARFMTEFKEQTDEILRKAREALEEKKKREQQQPQQQDEQLDGTSTQDAHQAIVDGGKEEAEQFEIVELEPRERFDCETILSTYSTLYNHPNIIAAAKKKVDPKRVVAAERSKQRSEVLQKKQQQQQQQQQASTGTEQPKSTRGIKGPTTCDDDEDGSSCASEEEPAGPSTLKQLEELGIDVTVRPQDESREEKKLRRQLIKTMQRERRQAKKALQSAYRDATVTAQVAAPEAKKAKGQVSLSLAVAAPRKR